MDFRRPINKQKGSALVFAMGLCTLVVILATSMILSLHLDMRRYDKMHETLIEQLAIQSATAWARSVLADDQIEHKTEQTFSVVLNGAKLEVALELPNEADEAAEEDEKQAYLVKTDIQAKRTLRIYTVLNHSPVQGWHVVDQGMVAEEKL